MFCEHYTYHNTIGQPMSILSDFFRVHSGSWRVGVELQANSNIRLLKPLGRMGALKVMLGNYSASMAVAMLSK